MHKLIALFKISFSRLMTYRADMVIYALSSYIQPLIGLAIWLSVTGDGNVSIMSKGDLILYFLMVIFVSQATGAWGAYFISEDIRSGEYTRYLFKPLSVYTEYLANNLTEKFIRLLFVSITLTIIGYNLIILTHQFINISPISISLFLVSLILAIFIGFTFNTILGLLSFWVTDNDFIISFFELVKQIFSGRLVPLIFFPPTIFFISQLLPFRYMISFPVEVLLNKLSYQQILYGFILQATWLGITVVLYKIINARGIRSYQSFGS